MKKEVYETVHVKLVLEFDSNSGTPSLKDIAEMITPYGDLTAVEQISTCKWGQSW